MWRGEEEEENGIVKWWRQMQFLQSSIQQRRVRRRQLGFYFPNFSCSSIVAWILISSILAVISYADFMFFYAS